MHLRVLGQSMIVLNKAQYAADLFDKKSRIYSNRPTMVMAGELVGWNGSPLLANPSPAWNEERRLLTQFVGTRTKVDSFNDLFQEEIIKLLRNLRDGPSDWLMHTRRFDRDSCHSTIHQPNVHSFAASITLSMAYGYKTKGQDDELVKVVDQAMTQFSEVGAPNAFLVDVLPIRRFFSLQFVLPSNSFSVRYVPSWLPGAGFKRKAQKYRKTIEAMLDRPYEYVQQQMVTILSTEFQS